MIRRNQRFRNHLDDNLIHLHKNFFVSPSDPQYYEKVIRYLDANSPEAHFKIGQKFQLKGNVKRAVFHYKEVLRTYPSPFYSAANRAIQHLDQQQAAHAASLQLAFPGKNKPLLPPFMKTLLLVLLVLNLMLVLLFVGDSPIYKTISKMKVWGVGSNITYETVDLPFVMYLAPDTKNEEIENALHKQALVLADEMPNRSILIYGVVSLDNTNKGKTMLLTNDALTKSAIVVAQYYPASDNSVRIRFLNSEYDKHQPLSAIGANLVRTALEGYKKDHGEAPVSLESLLQDYPNNYLSFIPIEAETGSNEVSAAYNGQGGWVYDGKAAEPEQMFYANAAGVGRIPYDPVHIEINKAEHHLKLVSGDYVLWDKEIGLGANGGTPQGDFVVQDRVQQPKGSHALSYGDAGLGLGSIALHGTYDESSIGTDKSLGCVRLSNEDVQQLFPFVPKGTEVQIEAAKWNSAAAVPVKHTETLVPAKLPVLDQSPEKVIFHWLG
ncbi:L,D-transpeptidase [Paenibacillus alba]|uniref:L,D-transpeptidase n=1 Tax=Paenibacillus alba TaxID=1197127 RepID=A0ABU6GE84_9BACL|nr:L,D-transpeptidase [Paenibacillus alba]MEC0232487.1 L,D-transpeptidase [Paenibacillus alba]